jgi:hypothetical protein
VILIEEPFRVPESVDADDSRVTLVDDALRFSEVIVVGVTLVDKLLVPGIFAERSSLFNTKSSFSFNFKYI